MDAAMIRNLSLSLILSVALTFIGAVLYVFSPILKLILGHFLSSVFPTHAETSGIAAVASGVSATVFPVALLTALILFLVIFTLLQRRSRKL
jgi:hypothetical protein